MITRSLRSFRAPAIARLVGAALTAFVIAGCHDLPTQPATPTEHISTGHLAVYALASNATTTLVVEVTGPGIVKANGSPDTLAFNIPMSGGVGAGSVQVPVGPSRTFTVRAFEGVTETHRGATTVDVVQGTNPAISITLIPFVGTAAITVSIGTTLVIVSPATRTLEIGDTLRLASQVIDQNGQYLSGGVVHWASLNPVRAQVDTLGLVTMRDTGAVQIVATYGTVGGSATLTGANHGSGISYYLTWNGKASQNWTDTTNWTAHGIAVARVPTGSDSVVIAASAARMPRLNACATATARDLVIEAGATLDYGCSSNVGISVSRSAVVNGTINADLRALRTSTLSGAFAKVFVVGDSVKLGAPTLAGSLQISGLGSQLLLSGKPLTVNGPVAASQGSRIALGGAAMHVNGNVTLGDTSWVEMTDSRDTLDVRGSLYFGGKDTRTAGLLSAGVLKLGGYLYASSRFSFAPTGTHATILDGTAFQYIQVDSAALNLGTWQNLTVRNPSRLTFSYYSSSNDSIALPNFQLDTTSGRVEFDYRRWGVTPAGGAMIVTDTIYSYYGTVRVAGALQLRSRAAAPVGSPAAAVATLTGPGTFAVAGALTTDGASAVDAGDVFLQDASGTANVNGAFSPGTLHLTALAPTLKPGLPYNGLALHGTRNGVTLTGATTFTGNGAFTDGSRLVLNGRSLNFGGALVLGDTSWVEMTNANDTLNVRGALTIGKKDARANNLLTAGTVRVGGNFTATNRFSFAASGSHTTILDGAAQQYVTADSSALNLGTWPNLTIRNPSRVVFGYYSTTSDSIALPNFQLDAGAGRVELDYRRWGVTPAGGTLTVTDTLYSYYGTVRIAGAMALVSRTAPPVGSPSVPKAILTGTGAFVIGGAFTGDASSAVDVADLYLLDNSGTGGVVGAFSPTTLHLLASQPVLAPSLAYHNLDLIGTRGGVLVTGSTTLTGNATLSAGSRLVLNGNTLNVAGNLALSDTSWAEMTNPADLLNVRGSFTAGSKDTRGNNLLTAGTLRIGGNFSATNRFSFAPSGSHATVLDGTSPQYVTADSSALNLGTWPNLTVRNQSRVTFSYYSTTSDSIALPNFQLDPLAGRVEFDYRRWGIAPNGGTLQVTDTLYSYYGTVRIAGGMVLSSRAAPPVGSPAAARAMVTGPGTFAVSGPFTADAPSLVDAGDLYLLDASGTTNVTGTFSPATVHLASTQPQLKPGLAYRGVELIGATTGTTLTGATTLTGNATLTGGSRLVLGGNTMSVAGDFTMNDASWVEMTNAADVLDVRGNLTFGSQDVRTTNLLSAGTLRVGHYLRATSRFSFAPSGTHQTFLDGTTYQNIQVDSAALNLGTWQNLTIKNPSRVEFSYTSTTSDSIALPNFQIDPASGSVIFDYRRWGITPAGGTLTVTDTLSTYSATVRIEGALTLSSRAAAPVGSPAVAKAIVSGGGTFAVSGALTADASSIIVPSYLELSDASGTAGVAGGATFSPSMLRLTGSGQSIKSGFGYVSMEVSGTPTVSGGPLALSGSLKLMSASAALTLPATSSVVGTVETYGDLQFAGKFVGGNYLNIHAGGRALAQSSVSQDFVDFVGIYNQEAASGQLQPSILDNTAGNAGAAGFRRKASGGFYSGATSSSGPNGILYGPVPMTY